MGKSKLIREEGKVVKEKKKENPELREYLKIKELKSVPPLVRLMKRSMCVCEFLCVCLPLSACLSFLNKSLCAWEDFCRVRSNESDASCQYRF